MHRKSYRSSLFSGMRKGKAANKVSTPAGCSGQSRHQVAAVSLYSEPVYALLDSGAIPNDMLLPLSRKLRINPTPTKRRIKFANGTVKEYAGIVEGVPVSFDYITVPLSFLFISHSRYALIIGAPILTSLQACLDLHQLIATLTYEEKKARLSLQYEPHAIDTSSEEEFTSDRLIRGRK